MISVSAAKQVIANETFEPRYQKRGLLEAAGKVLARPVIAPGDVPAFPQSSMDGYAIRFQDLGAADTLAVTAEVPAGKREKVFLSEGQAARIFTGAPLPEGADTVVIQELTSVKDGRLTILDQLLSQGDHTRLPGAEIQKGAPAMEADAFLSPGAIGFLAAIGITEVMVFSSPSVGIVVTGDELQQPGKALLPGQVYESASLMLRAALHQMDIREIGIYPAKDSLEALQARLVTALETNDVVLISGGVSVGDYDFAVPAATACGATTLFHGVSQRPGKPLYFGRKEGKPLFGLPGNPSSGLTCFYEYVWPLLRRLCGKPAALATLKAPLTRAYEKTNGLTQFLKGHYQNGEVAPLAAQESFRLSSFALANCLIQLEEPRSVISKGDLVEIHLLPAYG